MGNSVATKHIILEKAFELIYQKGYQSTSVDEIIAKTKLTKGAFYYNFKTKDEMGLSLINDLMNRATYEYFVQPLIDSKDPIKDIYSLMHFILLESKSFRIDCGCPVHNLVQEMSGVHPDFNKALNRNIEMARKALMVSLELGIKNKQLHKFVNPEAVSNFIISGYAGVRNLGKLYGNNTPYKLYLKELKNYLQGLK